MLIPGTTNGDADATTRVWIGGETWALVATTSWTEKTPETKFASELVREVLTFAPVLDCPVRVTSGTRTF